MFSVIANSILNIVAINRFVIVNTDSSNISLPGKQKLFHGFCFWQSQRHTVFITDALEQKCRLIPYCLSYVIKLLNDRNVLEMALQSTKTDVAT